MTAIGRALLADPSIGAAIEAREVDALRAAVTELRREPQAADPDFDAAISKLEAIATTKAEPKPIEPTKGEAEVKP